MTGFRVAHGGAQAFYAVTPDITCLGKVIGGGLPVGAYGGSAEIMRHVAPLGSMYQAGTLSGNPLAMAAGIATLEELRDPHTYDLITETASAVSIGLRAIARKMDVPVQASAVGGMWGFFFAPEVVIDYTSAKRADTQLYARFFHKMLDQGVYLAPSQFEAAFVSTQHSDSDVEATLKAASVALR
jgi:glutamate-1-semialdehyde 2,1-aminomutase